MAKIWAFRGQARRLRIRKKMVACQQVGAEEWMEHVGSREARILDVE